MMKITVLLASIMLLASCSFVQPVLKDVSEQTILKYCNEFSPAQRTINRNGIAKACFEAAGTECGVVVQCPGDNWNDLIPNKE